MIGVLAVIYFRKLYCSYFGVALALIFQTRFSGFGSWIAILKPICPMSRSPMDASAVEPGSSKGLTEIPGAGAALVHYGFGRGRAHHNRAVRRGLVRRQRLRALA